MPEFISGNSYRLFINTSLGCTSACSYCYLPDVGLTIGTKNFPRQTWQSISTKLLGHELFRSGRLGTILSIGCFSECWDATNKPQTISLIKHLLPLGNAIQLATKRRISQTDIEPLARNVTWEGQLTVFVSCATISRWHEFEPGTPRPEQRFHTFQLIKSGVPSYLYIKPVLQHVTKADLPLFEDALKRFSVSAVVGERFSLAATDHRAPIGEGILFAEAVTDEEQIVSTLSSITRVFRHSTEATEVWRSA